MPNDLTAKRNLSNRRADAPTSQRQKLVSSGFTASIWTISGVVLAACSSTIEDIEEFLGLDDGGDGGGNALHVQRSPVQGARIYFDMDNNGMIDAADITAQDEAFPQGFVTDAAGRAHNIPAVFHGLPFKAVLDGAIDVDTGTPLSGELRSIPGANGDHRLASPITEYIAEQADTAAEVVAEWLGLDTTTPLPPEQERMRDSELRAILTSANYQGGDARIETLAVYLAHTPLPDPNQITRILIGDTADPDNTLIVVSEDMVSSDAVTIGAHDSYVATIQAVSHAGGVGYRFVDADGDDTTISDFSINAQGVISFIGENPTTTTLHIEVSNNDASESEIVRVEVTVADAPSLDELPAGDETATIMENVAGGSGDGTALITGITTSATNPSWEISEANPAGQSAIADKFDIVSGTGDTFNLVLKSGEILNYDAIPGGVLNLHVWAEVGVDKVRSNALALRIQVEQDPDEVAFSGSFTGIVAEDGDLVAQGTFSVENQPENEAVDVSSQGAFGELVLGDNGAWTYTLTNTNADVDALLTGQTLIDTATISVGTTTQNIVIRIDGTNEDVRFVDGDGNRITSDVAENGIEIGLDATNGVSLGDVVPEIRGLLPSNDASNVVLADNMGGLFSLDSATGILTFTGTAAQIAALNGSANLVLVLTAPASIGDEEVRLDLRVNVINEVDDGRAEYEVTGDVDVGQTLTVSRVQGSDDPDGIVGTVSFQWFRGDEGTPRFTLLSTGSTYSVTQADIDSSDSIGVFVRYTDGSGVTYTHTDGDPATTIAAFASPVSFTGPAIADRTIDLDEDTSSGSTVHFAVRAESLDENDVDVGIDNYMLLDANNMPTTTYRGFTIDTTSGDITLTGSLDYEDTTADGTRIILRVRATDMNSPAETATLTLTVNVDDVNEHAPAFAQSAYTAEISESRTAADGTILEITATDADGTNNAVSYSITAGDPDDLFFIDPNSGEIRVANGAVLNYDTDPTTTSYTLEITATDGDNNNPMTTTQDVIITLTDVNDVAPTIAASTDTGAVEDGDADGTDTGIRVVISDDAMDEYQFTYIHTVGFADISGFELRQVSGTTYGLYTTETFDFDGFDETIKNIGVLAMTIGVRDTLADGSRSDESIIPVRITITDTNDNAPSLTVTGTGTIAEISDTASATHPAIDVAGLTLTTADADTGTYAVVEAGYFSTNDARFAVVAGDNANDWTLQLKANAALDFETDNPITLTITLDDGTNPATTRDVTINIGNEDDGMADYLVTQSGTELTVALVDDNPNSATYSGDPDGVNGGVSYRWFTTNNNGVTQIPITGITDTTSARLDVSTHTLTDGHIYGVAISYTDNANMAYTGDNAIIVLNSGVRFGESNYAISITDGAAPASVMIPDTSAMLTPPKTGVTITYDFDTDGNPGDYFSINPTTGALTLKAAVDYDAVTDKIFTLTLKATPSDTDIKPTTATVTVTLVDENDNKPSLSVVGGINTATIIENAVDADVGISFTITDADAPATNGFTANSFDIAAGADTNAATAAKFTIVQDGDDWDLRLKSGMSLDYETDGTTGTIKLAITVNDGQDNNAGLSDAETITITVTDLNDNPPRVSGESGTATLTEADAVSTNTETGYSITLADDDTDAVNRHEFTILGNESNRFKFVKDGTTANQWNLVLLAGQTVDREADGASIMLNFQVTDGNNPPLTALSTTVAITDANDNGPTVTVTGTGAIDERISGNTATITATGITITLADADATAGKKTGVLGPAPVFTVTDVDGIDLTGWSVDDDGNGNWVLQYDNTAKALSAETSDTISLRIWVDDDDSGNGGRVESGVFRLTVNNLDEGDASYAITGTTANNGMLSVALDTNNPDPDGLVAGSETYRWFILNSDDTIPAAGDTNGNIDDAGSDDGDDSTLKLPADVGNNVYGVVVTYRDNAGETETVTVIASAVQFSQNTYTVSFNEATAKPVGDGVADNGLVLVTASLNTNPSEKPKNYKFLDADGDPVSDYLGFTIGTSGIINFAGSVFDFDNITDKVYRLTVQASYKSGETGIATVEITITDANDIVPVLSQSGTATPIMENDSGANTGIVFSVDDADTVGTLRYDVAATTRNANNDAIAAMFEVDKSTGMLKLSGTNALDREHDALKASGQISLTITAHDGVRDSNTETVTITVTDLNDNPPTSSGESGTATLIEAAAVNTNTDTGYSFTLADDDTDAVNRHEFMILGGESSRFAFVKDGTTANQWNLVLLAGQTVDREMDGASIMLNFQVNDESNRPLTALSTTVAITDANEANPTVAITSIATTQGEQTVAAGGVNVASFAITDADATAYARANVALSGDSRFEITGWDAAAKTGMIRLKAGAVLDYETAADRSITLTITATDPLDNSVTDTDTVTITVTDENDNAPTATTSGTASLTEADAVNTNTDTGFSITLADDDTDTVNQHAITIDDTTLATRFGFVKDGTTANQWNLVLLANQIVDREGDGETLTIAYTISDGDDAINTPITDSVDVSIIDANDEPTVIGATKVLWESPTVSGTIPEGSYTAGTEIASAIVNDADAGANLEYRLTKGGSTFSIGSTDGIITFTADTDLDADTAPTSYTLAYEVRDRNGAWESSGDITLTITGIDDEKPEFGAFTWQTGTGSGVAGEEHIRTINEDQGASPILVMSVSDPDTATASLTPTIQGGSPVDASNNPIFSFGILNNQAILSVLSSRLDYETAPNTYTLTLVVNDGTRTATETVTINVGDINDNVPDIVVADSTPSVTARTASADTDIITGITVTDADVGKTYAQGDFALTGDSRFDFVWDATAQTGSVVLTSGSMIAAGTISLSLTVTDANPVGHSGTDTETLTITVTELVNGGTTGTAMQYDPSAADASGTLTYIDAALVKANPVAGDYTATGATYGTATVDESGAWTYNVDNTHAMVKGLASGATLTDTFTISVPLAAGGTGDVDVTVTITGVTVVEGTANADTGAASGNPVNRAAATAFEVIHGSDHNDVITVGAEGAVVFGGYGDDTINLRNGKTDIVVYRFSSIDGGSWRADDGGDIINNFERDRDIFILVDDDVTPIDDLDTLLSRDTTPFVPDTIVALNDKPKFTGPLVDNMFGQFQINFLAIYDVDGPGPLTTPPTGENVFINFVNKVSRAGAVTQGLVNDDTGDGWDLGNNEVTDFSNVPNWLTTDIDAHVGLVVMSIDQLAIDVL